MPNEYSLSDVLDRRYQNQLALEAALMELTLHVEAHGHVDVGIMSEVLLRQSARTLATSNRV